MKVSGVFLIVGILGAAGLPRSFNTVIKLETTSETSANVSMGDLDGDGDLDIVLAKGRYAPYVSAETVHVPVPVALVLGTRSGGLRL